jgi:mono/diheme cytochrome c family protein
MSKRTFIVFGLLILVLAVVIPWLAFRSKGDAQTGPQEVSASLQKGQSLFQTNCGTCHTLYSAGTDGNYGPDLDELLAPNGPPEGETAKETSEAIKGIEGRVLNAVENGVDSSTPGRMPGGILNQEQAKEVAQFVATTAGGG